MRTKLMKHKQVEARTGVTAAINTTTTATYAARVRSEPGMPSKLQQRKIGARGFHEKVEVEMKARGLLPGKVRGVPQWRTQ